MSINFTYTYTYTCSYTHIYLSIYLSIYLTIHPSIYLSNLFIYIYRFIYLSTCLCKLDQKSRRESLTRRGADETLQKWRREARPAASEGGQTRRARFWGTGQALSGDYLFVSGATLKGSRVPSQGFQVRVGLI